MQALSGGSVMCLVDTVDGGDERLHPVTRMGGDFCRALGQRSFGCHGSSCGCHGNAGDGVGGGCRGGRCLHRYELRDLRVAEVDRGLGVDGGGGVMDLVNAVDGDDLGRALCRTGDGHHLRADHGCDVGDRRDFPGLGDGGEGVMHEHRDCSADGEIAIGGHDGRAR